MEKNQRMELIRPDSMRRGSHCPRDECQDSEQSLLSDKSGVCSEGLCFSWKEASSKVSACGSLSAASGCSWSSLRSFSSIPGSSALMEVRLLERVGAALDAGDTREVMMLSEFMLASRATSHGPGEPWAQYSVWLASRERELGCIDSRDRWQGYELDRMGERMRQVVMAGVSRRRGCLGPVYADDARAG